MYKTLRSIWVLGIIFSLLTSCASVTPKIDIFFADEGYLQYFVRPSNLVSETLKVEIDFTVRTKSGNIESVVSNFSLIGKESAPLEPEAVWFENEKNEKFDLDSVTILYADVNNFTVRFSSKMTSNNYKAMIRSSRVALNVIIKGQKFVVLPEENFLLQKKGSQLQFDYGNDGTK